MDQLLPSWIISLFSLHSIFFVVFDRIDMADVAPAAASTPASPKKVVAKKPRAKKPTASANHPPAGEMVVAAIKALNERGGSSLQAIKKYIAANYKVTLALHALIFISFLFCF